MEAKTSQVSTQLPAGWVLARLNEIAQINPPLDRCITDDQVQVTFVPMRAVDEEGGGLARPEVRTYGQVKKGYTSFLSGDVIMAKITPCMENGKTTVVPDVPDQVCFGSTEFHVLRPEEGVQARWIAQYVLQHEVRRAAQRSMTGGVGQMRVPAAFLDDLRIPLAPAEEQNRIADTIDELFSDLDAGVAALERVREKLKLYRASVLKAAVEGALTAEWRAQHPHTEPASQLLQRILAARRHRWEEDQRARFKVKGQEPPKNWKAKYKEPKQLTVNNRSVLPNGWTWVTVEIVASGHTGAIQSGPFGSQLLHSEFVDAGILAIGIDNVLDGHFSLGREQRISLAKFEVLQKFEARPGNVVITVMATVGRVCVLPQNLERAIITKHCYRVTPIESLVDSNFLALAFRADSSTRRHIFGNVRGQTRPGINGPILKAAPVPLPPLEEQQAIVEMVEDQLSIIEHLEADLATRLKDTHGLRQALLRHAFTGQLVSQHETDEPASELLKRIAAERQARERQVTTVKRLRKTETRTE